MLIRLPVASLLTSSLTMANVLALSERSTAAPRRYEAVRILPVNTFSKLSVASSTSSEMLVYSQACCRRRELGTDGWGQSCGEILSFVNRMDPIIFPAEIVEL